MDYQQSLDYLYGLQRFGIKLGLDNPRALLERLDRPDRAYRCVQVAGTNGKGSVAAALAEILTRAGLRVGLYTSPHLSSFTERVQVNGVAISEAEVARLTERLRRIAEDIPATFFEFTTVLALDYFRQQQVDVAVLEVGLGGRLDATNVVDPCLSLITPISRDHTAHLGEGIAAIAAEKGGIIKPGVPVVVGRQLPEALTVLERQAADCAAPLQVFGRDYRLPARQGRLGIITPEVTLTGLVAGLVGEHQQENLAQAVCAALELRRQGLAIPDQAIRDGVAGVRWPGRLEWWGGGRRLLLDGAHNEAGASVLASYLAGEGLERLHWVVAVKADRRPADLLRPICPHVARLYCTVPGSEAGVDPAQLSQVGEYFNLPTSCHADPSAALRAALAACPAEDSVLVAGSLFLVGALRQALVNKEVTVC